MKNLIDRIKSWFPKKKLTREQQMLVNLADAFSISHNHLIAMARLTFIKPQVLVREAKNIKANGEYLLKMLEEKEEVKNDN